MEAELSQLAAQGATTLVGLMVTEAWNQVRARMANLFGRGDGRRALAVAQDLDETRREILTADGTGDAQTSREEFEEEWRIRLGRLLRSDPQAAADLRDILREYSASPSDRAGDHIEFHHNTFHGPVLGKGVQNSRRNV